MTSPDLPPCGLYRTTVAVGGIEAERLVYYHNHGNPGPGLYQPERWTRNRATFSARGTTVPDGFDARTLKPLPREGYYRVVRAFHCCEKRCVEFQPESFVQLGYNGKGEALLFLPELVSGDFEIPERGTRLDDGVLGNLSPLQIRERGGDQRDDLAPFPRGLVVH
jgi:hypothetical protein